MELNIMDLIGQYSVPVIVGICLCVGYMLKHVIKTDAINRYIPVIMGLLGLGLNLWITMAITPDAILAGLVSGLASTGLHQAFTKLIAKKEDQPEE